MAITKTQELSQVQKIHKDFYNSLDTSTIQVQDLEDIKEYNSAAQRLSSFGLRNSATYQKLQEKIQSSEETNSNNELANTLLEIEAKFPKYRLIGFKKVMELCERYNLYLSPIENYTGIIPNKNLTEMEKYHEMLKGKGISANTNSIDYLLQKTYGIGQSPVYLICAPMKDFNKKGLAAIGRTLQYFNSPKFEFRVELKMPNLMPDPIVLSPLNIKGNLIFHIATAWGPESDDDYVTTKIKQEITTN